LIKNIAIAAGEKKNHSLEISSKLRGELVSRSAMKTLRAFERCNVLAMSVTTFINSHDCARADFDEYRGVPSSLLFGQPSNLGTE
jgi:hypothetical protein